jgi:uncharacterized membrane protein
MSSLTSPKLKNRTAGLHLLLLLGWLAIATGLRFYHLEFKPPWSDEWATIVFSLGHSFRTIPLDRVISLDTLLLPLQTRVATQPSDVIVRLMSESTHPPVYFLLTHLWLKMFSGESGLVSLWAARSLSALLGAVSIPAMFGLGWLVFRSRAIAHLAAALMAVSPFGIYLAQDARHYTLATLGIIASLACLIVALRHVQSRLILPLWLVLVWVSINSLTIATHYFFVLTLMAQMLVLLGFWLADLKKSGWVALFPAHWRRIYAAVAGTTMGGIIWLSAWRSIPDNTLIDWIYHSQRLGLAFLEPIGRTIAWFITMFFLLPVEHAPLPMAIASAIIILLVLCWLMPSVVRSWRIQLQQPETRLPVKILGGFVVAAIALILAIAYGLGKDLSLAARYQFIYFPAVVLLMAAALAQIWQATPVSFHYFPAKGKTAVIFILLMSFLGALTVIYDWGFQKPDRPNLLVNTMLEAHQIVAPEVPILIANLHKTHEQTGEVIGLAWEFQKQRDRLASPPQFLLAHYANDDSPMAFQTLDRILSAYSRPFQLWLVNFPAASTELASRNCYPNLDFQGKVSGYYYDLYFCKTP